jgi:hypothetical protein
MKRTTILLGVTLVGLLAVSGLAAAAGTTTAPADAQATNQGTTHGPGNGPHVNTTEADRALDGTHSPFVTGEERLELFEDRFDLTDEQVTAIQDEVRSMVEDDAAGEDIRATVTEMLESYGVEDPTLGPHADGSGAGSGPHGPADGSGAGSGPHGPADGSCQG